MRRIVAFNHVSADGYFAAEDGGLDWVVPEPELDRAAADSLGSAGTILFGRRTYEMFESFWPTVITDAPTAPDPHDPSRQSPEIRAMGEWINRAAKLVFSRTRRDVTWNHSRLIPELDPEAIDAMKREAGSDIMIFGSGSVVSQLTEHRLIDEYQFVVSPILIGSGRSLIKGAPNGPRLRLLESTAYPSGNVKLRYEPASES